MNVDAFKDLVSQAQNQPDCACNKTDFMSWSAWRTQSQKLNSSIWGKKELEVNMPAGQLDNLGSFDHQVESIKAHGYQEFMPEGLNYWSKEAPIAVYFYPYHDCEIHRCSDCNAIFLSYIETSGHAPEKRLRWVRPELIVEDTKLPTPPPS